MYKQISLGSQNIWSPVLYTYHLLISVFIKRLAPPDLYLGMSFLLIITFSMLSQCQVNSRHSVPIGGTLKRMNMITQFTFFFPIISYYSP